MSLRPQRIESGGKLGADSVQRGHRPRSLSPG
jgi:hypothetical protein